MNRRNIELDILKGITIVLMVAGHAEFPLKKYVYLFHMAVFVMASGYFFNSKYSKTAKSIRELLIKRLKSLWFPYFWANSLFIFLNNAFIKLNIYTTNPDILFLNTETYAPNSISHTYGLLEIIKRICRVAILEGGTQIGGALWFLSMMFKLTMVYCIIGFLFNSIFSEKWVHVSQTVVSVCFLYLGWRLGREKVYAFGLARVFSVYILFHIGHLISNFKSNIKIDQYNVLTIGISILGLYIIGEFGDVELSTNYYTNPIVLVAGGVLGWLLIYSLSSMLAQLYTAQNMFTRIGQNTLPILILHLLCFKLVNIIIVILMHDDLFWIAAFPTLANGDGWWWILYTIFGIVIPICLNVARKEKVKNLNCVICREKNDE